MNADYQKLLRWSESNQKTIREVAEKLKKAKKPDLVVHDAHERAFEAIDCLSCANCCRTTGPLLTPQDISRLAKRLKKTSEKALHEQFLRIDEDGDTVFRSMPCPFLMDDNHCSVYEDRPRACREFPHTDQRAQLNILPLTRKNARICPAVARIFQILQQESFR